MAIFIEWAKYENNRGDFYGENVSSETVPVN
jgi:hypothetical protein